MNHYLINQDCVFDEAAQELRLLKSAKTIKMTAMRSRCLNLLLEHADGNIIDKKMITQSLWGERGQFVSDANLTQLLYLLRKDLRDVGLSDFFVTVPRIGIRVNDTFLVEQIPTQQPAQELTKNRSRGAKPLLIAALVLGFTTLLTAADMLHLTHFI